MDSTDLKKQAQHEKEKEEEHKQDEEEEEEESEEGEEGEDEEEEESVLSFFKSPEEVAATRAQALELYNAQQYEAALPLQYKAARYMAKVNRSATHPDNGVYFLDYGLTQLRLLQIAHETMTDFLNIQIVEDDTNGDAGDKKNENNNNNNNKNNSGKKLAALQRQQKEEDEEAMETCFINLEVARVGIQKKEGTLEQAFHKAAAALKKAQSTEHRKKSEGDEATAVAEEAEKAYEVAKENFIQISNLHADVHDALALLFIEKDDYNAALEELETELLLYRNLQDLFPSRSSSSPSEKKNDEEYERAAVAPGKVVSVLYQIANCFLKDGDFPNGEAKLRDTLAEIEKVNTQSEHEEDKIPEAFVLELQEVLEDAVEMNTNGTFEKLKKEINDQYCADQMEKLPSAEEFYSTSDNNNNNNKNSSDATTATTTNAAKDEQNAEKKKKNPFVSAIPNSHLHENDDDQHYKSNENSCLSMPISGMGEVLGGADYMTHMHSNSNDHHHNNIKNNPLMKEVSNLNSNSQSLSIFPPQHLLHSNTNSSSFHFVKENNNNNNNHNNSKDDNNNNNNNSNKEASNSVVHTIVARKKPKQQQQQQQGTTTISGSHKDDLNENEAKKVRYD